MSIRVSGRCFFFKQKTAYEMRISDWSSDVCSSDLTLLAGGRNDIARDKRPHPESATQRLARPLQPKVLLRGSKDDSGRGLCFRLADFHEIARARARIGALQPIEAPNVQPFVFSIG